MLSGTLKLGASFPIICVIVAYIYKRHSEEVVLQERLRNVLIGLLQAEKKALVQPKKVAVGFGGCEDIITDGLELLKLLNFSAPEMAIHQDSVHNEFELMQLFAYFFQHGAAAE